MTSRERTLGASASPRIGRTTRLAACAPRARAEGQSSHQTIFVAGRRTRAQRWSAVLHATERLQHGPRPLIARNAANRLLICACDASDRTGGSRGAIVGHKLPQNRRQPSCTRRKQERTQRSFYEEPRGPRTQDESAAFTKQAATSAAGQGRSCTSALRPWPTGVLATARWPRGNKPAVCPERLFPRKLGACAQSRVSGNSQRPVCSLGPPRVVSCRRGLRRLTELVP